MKKTFENKLRTYFTLSKGRDCYGVYYTIEELGQTFYGKDIEENVTKLAEEFRYALSEEPVKALNKIAKKDNNHAEILGYRTYKVMRIVPTKSCVTFAALIRFDDTGEERVITETGLDHCIKQHVFDARKRYYTAGGLKDKEVDFIFRGVGFSSKSNLYTTQPQNFVDPEHIKKLIGIDTHIIVC